MSDRLEIVTTGTRLAAIATAWDALHASCGRSIFQSHGWVAAWWQTMGEAAGSALRIGLLWRGEALVAVLPLAISRRKGLRLLEWAAVAVTDYCDLLAAPGVTPDQIARLWAGIGHAGGFDLAMLQRLLPDAAARDLLLPAARAPRLALNHRSEVSYRVLAEGRTGAEWHAAQPKKTRQNYRRGMKALAEMAGAEPRFRQLDADAPLAPVLDRLAALKRKWLAGRGLTSALYDDDSARLLALATLLRDAGKLELYLLECGDRLAAISVNFVESGTMKAFVTTYDPEFERASPGTLLMMDYIAAAFDRGLSTVDFLCGAEPFKRRFATTGVTLDTVTGAASPMGTLAHFADAARHRLRTLRPQPPEDRAEAA